MAGADAKYRIGKRVPKSSEDDFGWQDVDINDIDYSKPIVVFFGSLGTTDNHEANGMAKMFYQAVNLKPEDDVIDVYSVVYSAPENAEEASGLDDIFCNVLHKGKNKKLPTINACKNMRNITLFSYCFGQKIVSETLQKVAHRMFDEFGYNQNEIQQILGEVLHIAYAPFEINQINYGKNIEFRSFNDNLLTRKNRQIYSNEIFENYVGSASLQLVDENTLRVYSNFFNINANDHSLKDFLAQRDTNNRVRFLAECLTTCVSFGIVNSKKGQSIAFEPLPSLTEIANMLQLTIDRENQGIRELQNKESWSLNKYNIRQKYYGENYDLNIKEIINGRISIDNVEGAEFTNFIGTELEPYLDTTIKENMGDKILKGSEIYTRGYNGLNKGIILQNGSVLINDESESNSWVLDSAIKLKFSQQNLDNSVAFDVDFSNKNLQVGAGITFLDREYESLEDLKSGAVLSSINGNLELSKKQTRVVLNLLLASNYNFNNLILENGISFNQQVLDKEIEVSQEGEIKPYSNKKEDVLSR